MRSAAAIACCRFALTRLSFLTGAVHQEQRRDERRELARRQPARRDLAAAVPERRRRCATPPSSSISGGSTDTTPRHLHVRAIEPLATRRSNFAASLRLGAERLDDAVPGERLGADVRQVLERLLAAPRRAPHPLAEPHQRIDDRAARR